MVPLSIGQKIFSIAAVILGLMMVVAVVSVNKTAAISEDLEVVVAHQLPVTEAVARINIHVLEHGVVLQRLFVFAEEALSDAAAATKAREQTTSLSNAVNREFNQTAKLLTNALSDDGLTARGKQVIQTLQTDLSAIEQAYRNFETHALLLLSARESGDRPGFEQLLEQLNDRQDAIVREIDTLRGHVETMTNQAVVRADHDERVLLNTNIILTVLATVLGFIFAAMVTKALVSSVKRLVLGTAEVEAGNLDTSVDVTTRDEVGTLTTRFNDMIDGLRVKERIKDTFGKYMDPRIVSNLLDHPEFSEPGGERREMTVMFIDLKGFTSISEKLPPDQLVQTVNGFFSHMTKAIGGHQGVVDKYMGDAVMAYWGPPFCEPADHAKLACEAAMEALQRLHIFRDEVAAKLGPKADEIEIDLRIGVSTGEMIVGTIGSEASRNFTVMGDPVNLGSRLEGANKAYGTRVMISERTRELAGDTAVVRELDLIRVKGKVEPTRVFELLSTDRSGDTKLIGYDSGAYQEALLAYRAQDWTKAQAGFQAISKTNPEDPVAPVYLDRIDHLRENPPPADWDGVWVFTTK